MFLETNPSFVFRLPQIFWGRVKNALHVCIILEKILKTLHAHEMHKNLNKPMIGQMLSDKEFVSKILGQILPIKEKYPDFIHPNIKSVNFVQKSERCFLEITNLKIASVFGVQSLQTLPHESNDWSRCTPFSSLVVNAVHDDYRKNKYLASQSVLC
ncbi:MAG: hypothetical protein WC832_09650 [Anaerolineales bacterium]